MVKCNWMTPDDLLGEYKEGINGAQAAFEDGVENPRQNPMEAAIKAIDAGIWRKNFQAGVNKWVKSLSNVSLEDWKNATIKAAALYADRATTVGAEHWGTYYAKGKSIIESAMKKFHNSKKDREAFMTLYNDLGVLKEV